MRLSIPKSVQAQVFVRDKWCCRYCGINVFFSPALKALDQLSPDHGYYHKNGRKDKMSPNLLNQCAAIDHVNPITLEGSNSPSNLICSCWKCNTTKSNQPPEDWIKQIIQIEDLVAPDGWDGFLGVLKQLDPKNDWLRYFAE